MKPGADEEIRPLVPPSGALPRRFGAGELRSAVERAVTIASILGLAAAAAAFAVRDRLPEIAGSLVGAAAVPLALHVASILFGKRGRAPLSVVFEPAGVTVHYPWSSATFAWGELIGLIPPEAGATTWILLGRRGVSETRIHLDASKGWIAMLIGELSGETFDEPPA